MKLWPPRGGARLSLCSRGRFRAIGTVCSQFRKSIPFFSPSLSCSWPGAASGIAADEQYLMVAEYGENGSDAKIVVFKRWN